MVHPLLLWLVLGSLVSLIPDKESLSFDPDIVAPMFFDPDLVAPLSLDLDAVDPSYLGLDILESLCLALHIKALNLVLEKEETGLPEPWLQGLPLAYLPIE